MRSISLTTATTLAALFTSALANWDSKLCNGAGGCLGTSWFPGTDFVCPDGLKLTNQQVAQNSVDMSSGLYDYVSADAFPKSCLRDVVPGPEAKLISHRAANGLMMYAFILETCRNGPPITPDCYNANPNPSGFTLCQITSNVEGPFCTQAKQL